MATDIPSLLRARNPRQKVAFEKAVEAAIDGNAPDPAAGTSVNTVAATGATEELPNTSDFHDVTMDEDCAFTFAAPVGDGAAVLVALSGAFTPTWPASVVWDSATEPTYATPSLFTFVTFDGGTSWYGTMSGSGFAAGA